MSASQAPMTNYLRTLIVLEELTDDGWVHRASRTTNMLPSEPFESTFQHLLWTLPKQTAGRKFRYCVKGSDFERMRIGPGPVFGLDVSVS